MKDKDKQEKNKHLVCNKFEKKTPEKELFEDEFKGIRMSMCMCRCIPSRYYNTDNIEKDSGINDKMQ